MVTRAAKRTIGMYCRVKAEWGSPAGASFMRAPE
jgi:hypothetical protein